MFRIIRIIQIIRISRSIRSFRAIRAIRIFRIFRTMNRGIVWLNQKYWMACSERLDDGLKNTA